MAMTFQLKDFDGPLDLLLFLINKEKIDIKDIFVSQITDQYIDSVRNAPDLDMDDATDFLVMAATLLEIKSRAMLPRPPRIEEGEEDQRRPGSRHGTQLGRPAARRLHGNLRVEVDVGHHGKGRLLADALEGVEAIAARDGHADHLASRRGEFPNLREVGVHVVRGRVQHGLHHHRGAAA